MITPYRKSRDGNELPDWKEELNAIRHNYHRTVRTLTDATSGIAHLHNIAITS